MALGRSCSTADVPHAVSSDLNRLRCSPGIRDQASALSNHFVNSGVFVKSGMTGRLRFRVAYFYRSRGGSFVRLGAILGLLELRWSVVTDVEETCLLLGGLR